MGGEGREDFSYLFCKPKVREAEPTVIGEDGTITGEKMSGNCAVTEGTCYIDLELDGKEYHGVLLEMEDEAGNTVLAIMAAGDSNETVWCVKYI